MLMHDLWREYIPPVFPSNEVPFERRGKIDGVRSSIFEGRGDFFQGGCFVRARMEEIDERSIKSDRYSYFYDRTVDDELVWWHSLVEKW